MKQELLLSSWRHHPFLSQPPPFPFPSKKPIATSIAAVILPIRATLETSVDEDRATSLLTAKEKRQLRSERRERNSTYNWREELEERLMKKPKKVVKSWKDDLNLDLLSKLGHQWWIVKASNATNVHTLAKALIRKFPDLQFKLCAPAVQVKRKLKNGSISVKPKPLFPSCIFLHCVMNKEVHDFIRECQGVRGFVGAKVGNTKRQINKPKPVSSLEMEAIFKRAKEEQEIADQAFKEKHSDEGSLEQGKGTAKSTVRPRKASDPHKLRLGSTVRIVSGAFADFLGTVKKLDAKRKVATVSFTLFGKETLADLDYSEIIAVPN